ncbi:DUF2786 domain-containing protein [Roseateles sp.]|uniref:DUF2786 domain-containing protein n=1 Tax=Roseateles sp. TaxID=1971397 RepID=UPI0039647D19
MTPEQARALSRVRRCLDLAADVRGNPTERETAWRQAQALIAKHGLQLERFEVAAPAEPAEPPLHSPEWAPYWAKRTTGEALAAGVRTPVLCRDGWLVAG